MRLSTEPEEPVPYRGVESSSSEKTNEPSPDETENGLETETETDGADHDPSLDSIGPDHPVVDQHDRMWAEVDVLDDAQKLASQVKTSGSFFGPAHAQALENLRRGQIELAQKTADVEAHRTRQEFNDLWENGDIGTLRKVLFDDRHFDQISADVQSTVERLDQVSALMRAVDEQSRELWNTLGANEIVTFPHENNADPDSIPTNK